jgi:hypothetical protein
MPSRPVTDWPLTEMRCALKAIEPMFQTLLSYSSDPKTLRHHLDKSVETQEILCLNIWFSDRDLNPSPPVNEGGVLKYSGLRNRG